MSLHRVGREIICACRKKFGFWKNDWVQARPAKSVLRTCIPGVRPGPGKGVGMPCVVYYMALT